MTTPRPEALTPASEKLINDWDRYPDAIDASELSGRLWLVERQAAERAARQTPDSGLRDAAQAVCAKAELDDSGFDGECLDYLVPIPTIRTLRAALADTAERPLDVERLADAMLNEADRQAIEGPSYPKGWRGKAERLAAEYARLTEDQP